MNQGFWVVQLAEGRNGIFPVGTVGITDEITHYFVHFDNTYFRAKSVEYVETPDKALERLKCKTTK